MKLFTPFVLLSSAIALSACGGGEPSASDIQAALKRETDNAVALFSGGQKVSAEMAQGLPKYIGIDKDDCEAKEANGVASYFCSFTVTMEAFGSTQSVDMHKTFVKDDNGWRVTDL